MRTYTILEESSDRPNAAKLTKYWRLSPNIAVAAVFEYRTDTDFVTSYVRIDDDNPGGGCDYPLKYEYDGVWRMAYNNPGRHSNTTKNTVWRAYRWLDKQLQEHRGSK